ncbi:hypothetical protein OCK74_15580 [Chitinophagaceae bacterium LB-8]|uniref:Uncharacterized protein n=1 Tax=Paraflavisolibacter caeni TaxID=2982496 RepID=A0A9X3BG98_9BACT|nr:hypothetical protein [Paraflavisolibacter caeni]MCU7550539.1 hypothetical protein [Paraflavisolibacter caeni]
MKTRDNKKPASSRIPENDPSKAMDSKKEVEQSNDNKIDQDFPGYPHYPAREDIMDQRNDYKREDLDVENLPNSRNLTGVSQRFAPGRNNEQTGEPSAPGVSGDDDLGIKEGTEADVDDDDLAILDAIDNEVRTPGEIGTPQNVSTDDLNSDLDIPGTELDDENELIGEEDEENNYWSLGSDRRGFNEEDPYSGPKRDQE